MRHGPNAQKVLWRCRVTAIDVTERFDQRAAEGTTEQAKFLPISIH